MADPVITPCPEGVWTKVAASQTAGKVHIMSTAPDKYLQTYRDATGIAPTLITEGVPFTELLTISAAAVVDVYIWPQGADGSVRVDL